MNLRSVTRVLLPIIAVLILMVCIRLVKSPAFWQKSNEVVIREPGGRFLGPPQPVISEARNDLEFAWLSEAGYQRIPDNKNNHVGSCQDADSALHDMGWTRWADFPDAALLERITRSHLRVEVWTNPSRNSLAVTFGGTVASSGKDWKSNLRWFIPRHNDEYSQIVKEFGPAFVKEFLRRRQEPTWAFLSHAAIFSTGHSLGGGLAQQFAYSLPENSEVPRVKKVFAFDPSPVTGFFTVHSATRNNNKKDLAIDRIYERGEILAIIRSFTNFIDPPSATNPTIRQVRYNLFPRVNPISGHSMSELACKLDAASR
jgi:Lipase (class 3)